MPADQLMRSMGRFPGLLHPRASQTDMLMQHAPKRIFINIFLSASLGSKKDGLRRVLLRSTNWVGL